MLIKIQVDSEPMQSWRALIAVSIRCQFLHRYERAGIRTELLSVLNKTESTR